MQQQSCGSASMSSRWYNSCSTAAVPTCHVVQGVLQALVPARRGRRAVPHRRQLVARRRQPHGSARQRQQVRLRAGLAEQAQVALAGGHSTEGAPGGRALRLLALCKRTAGSTAGEACRGFRLAGPAGVLPSR